MDTDLPGLRLLLPDHHRRLEAKCQALLEYAYIDDSRGLATRWRELEPELLDHMAEEEVVILPDFARSAPECARQILAEHARIRGLIATLGADIARHEVRSAGLQELLAVLRAHAHDEDILLYPWAQRHLALGVRRSLFVRVCRWFGVASRTDAAFAT